MSSGFVSAGTNEAPIERDDAWRQAQQEIEERRRKKEEALAQSGGKSLYETLQANKAAKQEAFEEAAKLKNQFRALDTDEIDFLDTVSRKKRDEERKLARETADSLQRLREKQQQSDRTEDVDDRANDVSSDVWTANKKRKREKGADLGIKARRTSTSNCEDVDEAKTTPKGSKGDLDDAVVAKPVPVPKPAIKEPNSAPTKTAPPAKGLVAYASDDESDD